MVDCFILPIVGAVVLTSVIKNENGLFSAQIMNIFSTILLFYIYCLHYIQGKAYTSTCVCPFYVAQIEHSPKFWMLFYCCSCRLRIPELDCKLQPQNNYWIKTSSEVHRHFFRVMDQSFTLTFLQIYELDRWMKQGPVKK